MPGGIPDRVFIVSASEQDPLSKAGAEADKKAKDYRYRGMDHSGSSNSAKNSSNSNATGRGGSPYHPGPVTNSTSATHDSRESEYRSLASDFNSKGDAAFEDRDYVIAVLEYMMTLHNNPESDRIRSNLLIAQAHAEFKQGRYRAAVEHMKRAINVYNRTEYSQSLLQW